MMHTYYPPITPNAEYKLAVDEIHTLYLEESGNRNGLPVIFLHGGPGAGCCQYTSAFQ
jgi:proline iminopeptidase